MIAAATEMEQGMNCWNAGKGPGQKYYPDFGQWVPKDEFECFKSCAAWMWADEKWWFCDRQDVDWEAFMPTIDKWNFTRPLMAVMKARHGTRPAGHLGCPLLFYCVTFLALLQEPIQ
jgi:hypothetical protein